MKAAVLVIASIALAVIVVACNPNATDSPPPSAGAAVRFEGSGVSLVPGDQWKQIGENAFGGFAPPGVCLPTLAGKAGLIQVLLLPPDRSDRQTAAAGVREAFEANPKSIKDSLRQEAITVSSGTEVIYLSYLQHGEGDAPESRSHNYILKNRAGRGVAISYLANARTDSETVHQMIRQTLRVE